jgi:hypothetical protein
MKKKRAAQSAFFNRRALVGLLVCGAAACSILSRALLGFFGPEPPAEVSQRTLTRCPQRVDKRNAALPPAICTSGDSSGIAFGEADPPKLSISVWPIDLVRRKNFKKIVFTSAASA